MPQDVEFFIPFPPRVSPDLDRAHEHNAAWLDEYGLDPAGPQTELAAAASHPQATGEELDLGLDQAGFCRLFDDSFEGPLGLDPEPAGAVCREFAAHARGSAGGQPSGPPLLNAYLDVWSRSRTGMSGAWCERAGRDWATFFMGYPAAAEVRQRGIYTTVAEYVRLRRRMSDVRPSANLVERLSGFEIPARVFYEDQVQRMIIITEDVVTLIRDVQCADRYESGDELLLNVIFILELAYEQERTAAINLVQARVRSLVEEFLTLRDGLPDLAERLALTRADHTALEHFATDGLATHMRAVYDLGHVGSSVAVGGG